MTDFGPDSGVIIPNDEVQLENPTDQDDLPLYMRKATVQIVSANELLNRCRLYLSENDCQTILGAYRYADEHHLGQFRKSGEPYITHPLAVASILASWHMDCVTIQAGLMHDVLEDTGVSKIEMAERFGIEVANVVDGVSKLDKLKFKSTQIAAAESFRKLLLAMAKDVRVILVKLADRVHNMRTLGIMRPEKRCRISQETLDIYVPIAHRLGMNLVFRELQELSFLNMQPERFRELQDAVVSARENRKSILERILQETRRILPKYGIRARVIGRDKTMFGIYNTMTQKNIGFHEALDIYGFRIIVRTTEQCYLTLCALHALYTPVPGRFKDFIAIPKPNGYQSLHTTVIGPNGTPIEYQIRTEEMHRIAEYGILTYWLFNDHGASSAEIRSRTAAWLQSLLEIQRQSTDSSEFIENIKIDLFPDRVYVFTPKSRIIALPKGSTPVDFAYQIHTDVGNHTVGCRVNGEQASLNRELRNGEMVEIITDAAATPNPEWLRYVRSGKARAEVRQYLRTMKFGDAVKLGQGLVRKAAEAAGFDIDMVPEDIRRSFLREVSASSVEAFYVDVGLGKHVAEAVVNRLSAMMHFTAPQEDRKSPGMAPVEVRGNEGMALSLAACCHPIPGDEILGFIRPGKGLYIHRKDCEHARQGMASDPGRWMAAHWSETLSPSARFPVPLEITARNERAAVAACVALVAREQGAITGLSVDPAKDGILQFHLMLQVHDRMHLSRIVRSLSHDENVLSISRRLSELVRSSQEEQAAQDPENRFNSEDLFAAADSR